MVAERIRKAIDETEFKRHLTASLGVGVFVQNMDRHELILKADRALYEAKKSGRNRICVFG